MSEKAPKVNIEENVFKPVVDTVSFDDVIVDWYLKGAKLSTIMEKFEITTAKIYDILNRAGVQLRTKTRESISNDRLLTITEAEKQELARDYKSGMHIKELFKKYKLNKHGFYKLIDQMELPRRNSRALSDEQQLKFELDHSKDKVQTDIKYENGQVYVNIIVVPEVKVEDIKISFSLVGEEN